jgi:hypothetical protein
MWEGGEQSCRIHEGKDGRSARGACLCVCSVGIRCRLGSAELPSTYRHELEGKVAYKIIVAEEEGSGQA